jgi:hypothetical protein
MLLSKGKIVQSSGGNRFAGIVVRLFRRRRSHVQARIGNSDTRHLLRRRFCAERVRICPAGIDRNDLCVTNGNVSVLCGGWLAIDTPSSRAVVRADAKYTADQVAEIHFRYLGPTQTSKPLASGELRRGRRVARARLPTAMASAPAIRTAATANVTRPVPRGTIIGKGTGGPPLNDADYF